MAKKGKLYFLILCLIIILSAISLISYKIVHYKMYIWLPGYFTAQKSVNSEDKEGFHLMFLIADHYEPGAGDKGIKKNHDWIRAYQEAIKGIQDDYGNPMQHTWFYAYDHLNSQVVLDLNDLVYKGLGEIEFHWHHGLDTNLTFPPKLKEAITWFNSHGCMISEEKGATPHFAFVHGNWALDNSDGNASHCGVNREIDILWQHGGYADFTFSTFGTSAQPSKINSIYFVKDTENPKSYNSGEDVSVGSTRDDFIIFEGPITWDSNDLIFDCAAIENTSPPKPHRVKIWLDSAIAIKGKQDWLFIKVYTHAAQSKSVIADAQFRHMLEELIRLCHLEKIRLHFVTAREAYNILKAAQYGEDGDPEVYRDYIIQKPINRVRHITERISMSF